MSKITILSPVSKISTVISIIALNLFAHAQPYYAMTVVKEARVSKEQKNQSSETLKCKNDNIVSIGSKKLGWSYTTAGVQVAQVGKNAAVLATRTNDERLVDTLTLWLAVKSGLAVKYYAISEMDTIGSEALPKVSLQNKVLTVEVDTLTTDDSNPDIIKAPDQYGHLYQTIRLGEITEKGLELSILSCTR